MTGAGHLGSLERVTAKVAPIEPAREEAPTPVPFHAVIADGAERAVHGLGLDDIRAMLEEGRFSSAYEPIVHTKTARTVAYEALARFRRRDGRAVAPARVFSVLHADPALLLRAELTVKLHQVERAPNAPLFVNLDPDCWTRAGDRRRNPFLGLFGAAPTRVVVEVTEALATADSHRAHDMIEALRGRGHVVALDDIGAANGLLSFDAIVEAQVLKFDRTLIPRLRHPRCRALVAALTRMARETGAHTVMEGVETTAEFVLARDLGFDLVQGYLFKDRQRLAR
jgi:EAL domain-containing protein (putative c-di-GMP-specific phosphodiesterase class I)